MNVVGAGLVCALMGALAPAAHGAPPNRAYEMVSPLDKNGAEVEIDGSARASAAGDRVTYTSFGNFGGGGGSTSLYNTLLSARSNATWSTNGINPPADFTTGAGAGTAPFQGLSEDLSKAVVTIIGSDPVLGGGANNLFASSVPGGPWTPLSLPETPIPADPFLGLVMTFAGASRDFSHLIFESHRPLNQDDSTASDGLRGGYLYEWTPSERRLVDILPDDEGGGPAGTASLGRGLVNGTTLYPGDNAISPDGSHIFFTINPETGPRAVYLRVDSTTVRVGTSERTDCAGDPTCGGDDVPDPAPDPAGEAEVVFQGASTDGSKAFLTSGEKLTDDSKATLSHPDLYRWDGDAPAGERLTDLTAGDAAGGGVGDGSIGDLLASGFVEASEDGSRAYFVALGVLDDGATADQPNLYVWDEDAGVRYIATLDGGPHPTSPGRIADQGVWSLRVGTVDLDDPHFRDARLTPDGERLIFRSRAALTGYDTDGQYQLYLFDASDGELQCISCNPRATSSTANVWLKRKGNQTETPLWPMRNLSADGSRVFFDSAESLVAKDTNGKYDVYEWEGGELRLISGGQDAADSAFLDASANGDDVFFTTRQRLACQDFDNLTDVYDATARNGGGSPPCAAPPPCLGEQCQGQQSTPPVLSPPASITLHGAGNAPSPKAKKAKKCKRGFVKKKVKGKTKCVRKKSRSSKHGRSNSKGRRR